jgi:hypothetical protein
MRGAATIDDVCAACILSPAYDLPAVFDQCDPEMVMLALPSTP